MVRVYANPVRMAVATKVVPAWASMASPTASNISASWSGGLGQRAVGRQQLQPLVARVGGWVNLSATVLA